MNYPDLKKQLHTLCIAIVQQRIVLAKQAMDSAQESANQEEKSSAGDKYETGRAMAQIERDQAAQQLDEGLKLKKALDQINPNSSSIKAGLGSLVITDQNRFYISISAGKLEVDGKEYIAISPQSPIGKLLLNRNINDEIKFQNMAQAILEIH
ncbi:MAG: 3-oxoacyl-ACP synthase [Bacteroidetes bacterium]|nr:3-oxoacyl-ACP synthase [Bacteroidota bacterium]MBI3481949.1 3-oxoacyl-ACP synthase [Bacteroidota bacterium]